MLDGNSLFQVSIALHPSAPAGGIHSDGSPAPYLETTICSIANPFFSAASKLVFSFGEGSLIDGKDYAIEARLAYLAVDDHPLGAPHDLERRAYAGPHAAICPHRSEAISNRSEEQTFELQSLMRISYAVFR